MLMMLAREARIISISYNYRLGTAEKMCETTATRRVYETPVGCPRGAADAHDAGPGALEKRRKTLYIPLKTCFERCKLRLGPKAVPKTQDTPDDADMGARVSANPMS